jgi:uncharacterized protein YjdB
MRAVSPILYAYVVGLLLACSDSTGPSQSELRQPPQNPGLPEGVLQISPATATLQYGQTLQFTTTYSGNPALAGGLVEVAWQSSNESVATVSKGLVRGVSGGETRIVASWGGYQASALVTVSGPWKKHEDHPICLKRTSRAGQLLMTQC